MTLRPAEKNVLVQTKTIGTEDKEQIRNKDTECSIFAKPRCTGFLKIHNAFIVLKSQYCCTWLRSSPEALQEVPSLPKIRQIPYAAVLHLETYLPRASVKNHRIIER